ncbi:MAG: NAD(P)H-dependent oxidoreductase [Desulfovibrio sp.]
MKILVILGHPHPGSLNHALAEAACESLRQDGHEVVFHDLCAEGFDPALPHREIPRGVEPEETVEAHVRELEQAEGIVIVHPNWWGMPPAVLKGWIDRVFRPGRAYTFADGDQGEGVPRGLLKARAAVVFNTSNTFAEREISAFGDPLERLWKDCIFGLCGVERVHRRIFSVVVTSDLEQRRRWIEEVRETVQRIFAER